MTLQTLGCWSSVSLFKQCCLNVWNYSPGQIRLQENIPTDGNSLREQGRHVADLVQGEPWRPKGREGGSQGLRAPTEIFGNPGPSDQTRHTQRGMAVGSETRSSTVFTLLISTCGLFSALSIVSGLSQAFRTCLRSGPRGFQGGAGLVLHGLRRRGLSYSPPFHTPAPDTAPPGDGAPGSHPKGFNLLNEPELGKRPTTFLPPYSFLSKERRRGN